jgi:hypothetical protein
MAAGSVSFDGVEGPSGWSALIVNQKALFMSLSPSRESSLSEQLTSRQMYMHVVLRVLAVSRMRLLNTSSPDS